MLGAPRHGAVDEGLGKEQRIPGLGRRLDHVVRVALEAPDVLRQVAGVVGFVAARHAGKAAVALIRVSQKKGHHAQAIAHLAVAVAKPVVGILARAAVKTATGVAAIHDNGVVVVDADLGADEFDQVGQDFGVVDQVFGRLTPATDLVQVVAGVVVPAVDVPVHQRVEIVQFLRAEDVFDDQIAL